MRNRGTWTTRSIRGPIPRARRPTYKNQPLPAPQSFPPAAARRQRPSRSGHLKSRRRSCPPRCVSARGTNVVVASAVLFSCNVRVCAVLWLSWPLNSFRVNHARCVNLGLSWCPRLLPVRVMSNVVVIFREALEAAATFLPLRASHCRSIKARMCAF